MTKQFIAPPGFIPYPDPADVFANDVERHMQVFHPVLTVAAAEIDPAWDGPFHFVLPIEPYDGPLGEGGESYYGPHCGEGWIKFVREGSKYRFAGDWRYFAINRDPEEFEGEISDFYEKTKKDYLESRKTWRERGIMAEGYHSFRWINQLGGNAYAGNWSGWLSTQEDIKQWGLNPSRMPGEIEVMDGDRCAHPLNEQGKRYRLVGSLAGYFYQKHGADTLFVFYDAPSSTILIMPDFT